ncbi:uncharacterized protein A4U43_C04F23290 [Asparagus officinalis]|uniref:Uncharacterized protein n=1 Tax=Asparagus officinalis TaxID=4686 RepID=A0A5P1F3Q0_ASPOF|nr:uncharacterized protein A4U43_C04F23290 [Asparagus officinalis]
MTSPAASLHELHQSPPLQPTSLTPPSLSSTPPLPLHHLADPSLAAPPLTPSSACPPLPPPRPANAPTATPAQGPHPPHHRLPVTVPLLRPTRSHRRSFSESAQLTAAPNFSPERYLNPQPTGILSQRRPGQPSTQAPLPCSSTSLRRCSKARSTAAKLRLHPVLPRRAPPSRATAQAHPFRHDEPRPSPQLISPPAVPFSVLLRRLEPDSTTASPLPLAVRPR